MAVLIATGSGNLTNAAIWQVVNATGFFDYEGNSVQSSDATFRGYPAGSYTPGAIQIDGIIMKAAYRMANPPSGTTSVRLYNNTDAVAVVGTTVTVNTADFLAPVSIRNKNGDIGWVYFKFAAPVTLTAGKAYHVQQAASSTGNVLFYYSGTNYQFACGLVLTGAAGAAPTTGDQIIITGTRTGAGVNTTVALTMDQTSSAVKYGNTSTSLSSIFVGDGCSLSFGFSAATNYYMNCQGSVWIGKGGTLTLGTVANPIPRDSTATLNFNITGGSESYVLWCQGTLTLQGLSRTVGKNVVGCLLTATHTAGQVSFAVDRDTGWKSGDGVIISPTRRTAGQAESKLLNGDAGANSLAITVASSYNHDGAVTSAGVQGMIVSLFRNVVVSTESGKYSRIMLDGEGVAFDADWAKFHRMSGNSTSRGLMFHNPVSIGIDFCLFHADQAGGVGYGIAANGQAGSFPAYLTTWTNNVGVGISVAMFDFSANSNVFDLYDRMITDNWTVGNPTFGQNGLIVDKSIGRNLTLLRCVHHDSYANDDVATFNSPTNFGTAGYPKLLTIQDCVFVNVSRAISFPQAFSGYAYIKNTKFFRTKSGGGNSWPIMLSAGRQILFDNCDFQGSQYGTAYVEPSRSLMDVIWRNCRFGGESGYTTSNAITLGASGGAMIRQTMRFEGCLFGDAAGGTFIDHTQADLGHISSGDQLIDWTFVNCVTGTPTFTSAAFLAACADRSFLAFQREGGVLGSHRTIYPRLGIVSRDATFFRTSAPSEKISPTAATADFRLRAAPKRFDVSAGSQKSPSVYVYLDPAYNGLPPRLIMKANNAIGQDADAVLATHTGGLGTWEKLIGTMPVAAEDDGQVELIVDCTGTAGAVWLDDWSV